MHFNISNIDSHGTHINITEVKIYSPPDKIQNSKHHLEQHFLLQVCTQFIIRVTEQTDKPVALPSSSTHPLPIVTTQNKILLLEQPQYSHQSAVKAFLAKKNKTCLSSLITPSQVSVCIPI